MTAKALLLKPLAPGGTIGIVGGGQLGRMLALATANLGLKASILSDLESAPAFQVAAQTFFADYTDLDAVGAFARSCNAITFEFENVPAETVEFVAGIAPTNPNADALRVTQDRLAEKDFIASLGIPTPAYYAVSTPQQAHDAFLELGSERAVLKTRRFGYDGKGQATIGTGEAAREAFAALDSTELILERFVNFAFEASIVAARGHDGVFTAYDPPENIHENHILRRSMVPGRMDVALAKTATSLARTIAESLGYVGVFAVEFFVGQDRSLLVNEIAPRVHNSGHWTIEACAVSQFEQHIRAIAGWPLGKTFRHSDAVMENIIGDEAAGWQNYAKQGGGLHLYGKPEIRPGRKMGHITTLSPKSRK